MKLFFFTLPILLMLPFCSRAEDGYRIEGRIQGLDSATCYLGYHYGQRQFLIDTIQTGSDGRFLFKGAERLEPGMYILAVKDMEYVEILIDDQQQIRLYTDAGDMVGQMHFPDSPQNQAFYDYIRFMKQLNEEAGVLHGLMEATPPGEQQELRAQMMEMEQSIRAKQDEYIRHFPNSLFAAVLRAQREPDMPDPPLQRPDGSVDQQAMYQLFVNRYWDRMDFSDGRLVRTPVYQGMLNHYFNQVVIQHPDTVMAHADRVIEKSRANDELFRFTIWFLTGMGERSQIMGMDALFVHLVENHYMTGDVHWMDEDRLQRLIDRGRQLSRILIGETAPDLILYKPDGQDIRLHDIEANYLVMYFWDSECAFCREETPRLQNILDEMGDRGLKVFAINTETDERKWKEAIAPYSLPGWIHVNDARFRSGYEDIYDIYAVPTIYLLDKQKRIIAKGIGARQLIDFIRFYERQQEIPAMPLH